MQCLSHAPKIEIHGECDNHWILMDFPSALLTNQYAIWFNLPFRSFSYCMLLPDVPVRCASPSESKKFGIPGYGTLDLVDFVIYYLL